MPCPVTNSRISGDALVDALVGAFSPAGRLPTTMYTPDIIARDIRDVDLASDGGITHTWFDGPVLFPFGYGLSYAQFSFSMQFRGLETQKWSVVLDESGSCMQGCAESKLLHVRMSNSGDSSSAPSDCVLLVFIDRVVAASDAQLPSTSSTPSSNSPREALVAFQRFHSIAPGDSLDHHFTLEYNSVFAAFRNEHGRVQPPQGTYQLRIGHSRGESGARLTITVESSFDGVATGGLETL